MTPLRSNATLLEMYRRAGCSHVRVVPVPGLDTPAACSDRSRVPLRLAAVEPVVERPHGEGCSCVLLPVLPLCRPVRPYPLEPGDGSRFRRFWSTDVEPPATTPASPMAVISESPAYRPAHRRRGTPASHVPLHGRLV